MQLSASRDWKNVQTFSVATEWWRQNNGKETGKNFRICSKFSKIEDKDKIMENSYTTFQLKVLNFHCFLLWLVNQLH